MSESQIKVSIYLRERLIKGFRYSPLTMGSPFGYLSLHVPPSVGDRITAPGVAEVLRVVDRQWEYPAYGSLYWPSGRDAPSVIPMTVMVEHADGMFIDEEPTEGA